MKNVLIISSSLRKNSNSEILADEFARGALDAGNSVEKISLAGKSLAFCRGCLACQRLGRCVIEDDALWITEKMLHADVIVFATPVYYCNVSGQLKTLLDRANSLFPKDYSFRDIYLAAAATEDEDYVVEGCVKTVQGWVDCFERARLAGVIFGGGVTDPGEIKARNILAQAYETGRAV